MDSNINIDNKSQKIFEDYVTKQPNYIHNLNRGIQILKILQGFSCDSYIIGETVRDLILGLPITKVVIYTSASYPELSQVYKNILHDSKSYFFTEGNCKFIFYQLKDGKTNLQCFDKRLAYVVSQISFTFESLILSQAQILNDLTGGYEDLQNKVIRTYNKPSIVIKQKPNIILDAILAIGRYNFVLNKKLKKAIIKNKRLIQNISDEYLVDFIYELFQSEYYEIALDFINDNNIFKRHKLYKEYFKKISDNPKLPFEQKMLFIYLFLKKIPNKKNLAEGQVEDFEEKMVITNLLFDSKITNMLIYNIGEKTLCECDEIACLYNKKYRSQKKTIQKNAKTLEITNIRDLAITILELKELVEGDYDFKSKIILNILLSKVINREIGNNNVLLKQEAMKINQNIKNTFNYDEPLVPINYTPSMINSLLENYKKDFIDPYVDGDYNITLVDCHI